ncbi:5-formyltetrahydrofolate cyclo-ligase [Algoriphagus namhaensis]|uniref:5-formyltetrahydrofolate cyclo-ligase n=1 Tax=Algoriphagus namhaensis TaxID=915353 RepID=A0ABV8AN93_9BACT
MKSKNELRAKYRALRRELTAEQVESESHQILSNFINFFESLDGISHVHLFLPIQKLNEVNTFLILDFLWSREVQVYTSITQTNKKEMITVQLQPGEEFDLDEWGIPVPKHNEPCETDQLEMVLIPLLSVDLFGNRIGYGKGYYDQFLKGLKPSVIKVGLGFFEPEPRILEENHDVVLDFYIWTGDIFQFAKQE